MERDVTHLASNSFFVTHKSLIRDQRWLRNTVTQTGNPWLREHTKTMCNRPVQRHVTAKFLTPTSTITYFLLSFKIKYKLVYQNRASKRIITKNLAADPEIEFLTKSISKAKGCATATPTAWESIIVL